MRHIERERCGTAQCGACNAIAPIYALKPNATLPGWALYTMCTACKHDEFEGFMSEELKGNIDRRVELMRRWKKATTPAQRGRIYTEVKKITSSEETWNQSL